jgi:uncharacterized membrane protein
LLDTSKIDPKSEWFDPSIIPAIPKLLATDYGTILNAMHLINEAKDRKKIEEVTKFEARKLYEKWFRPDFLPLMMKYMQSLKNKKPQAKM